MAKSSVERAIETLTFGSILVLFGLTILTPWVSWLLFSFATAVLLLGSASYQRARGWDVHLLTWGFGGVFAALTVLQLLGIVLRLALGALWNVVIPVSVLALVVWFAWKFLTRGRARSE
ncbi:MAG: hypothetical protein JXB47_13535 [Anaerolineae bacterium]|nr:hypothetical protein [Anaerolineae bacterium]